MTIVSVSVVVTEVIVADRWWWRLLLLLTSVVVFHKIERLIIRYTPVLWSLEKGTCKLSCSA